MSTLQRTTLGFLALCLVAIWAYGIALVAWDVLDEVSAEWVWAGGMAIMLSLYLAFAKRALKDIKALGTKAPPSSSLDMEALERSVHNWFPRGDTSGSLAGSAIGIELIDGYLEGDM